MTPKRLRPALAALILAASALPAAAAEPARFAFTTDARFDAAQVPAYRGRHAKVERYIDTHQGEHLEQLRRWVRQPSISSENHGVREMADLLVADLKGLGFQEAVVAPTSGQPGVFGWYDAGAKKTLVIYMMFDVQPIEPTGWKVDPFAGQLVDEPLGKVLMARGATNQKGPQRAFLNAIEAIRAVDGKLPVNLIVLAEGEEEQGSPNFHELTTRYADRLRGASGVLFPAHTQAPSGLATLTLGVKGHIYFELEAKTGPKEIHSSYKAIVDSPTWRLVHALSSLTTPDGNTITPAGYYDPIRPPSEEQQRLVNGMADSWTRDEAALKASLGVAQWSGGISGRESLAKYLFDTTLNIDGIWSGYTTPGAVKTILPNVATAKLDSRLVPGQTPETALKMIREHLDRNGFQDVAIKPISGYQAAQTSVEAPIVRAAIGVMNKHGVSPAVAPRLAGSAPYYVFTERLNLPLIAAGLGHGAGAHGPNEYMVIEPAAGSKVAGLAEVEKYFADLVYAVAAAK